MRSVLSVLAFPDDAAKNLMPRRMQADPPRRLHYSVQIRSWQLSVLWFCGISYKYYDPAPRDSIRYPGKLGVACRKLRDDPSLKLKHKLKHKPPTLSPLPLEIRSIFKNL